MQNSLLIISYSEKLGYFSGKLKSLTSSTIKLNIFFAEILLTSPTCDCLQKRAHDFFDFA